MNSARKTQVEVDQMKAELDAALAAKRPWFGDVQVLSAAWAAAQVELDEAARIERNNAGRARVNAFCHANGRTE